MFQPTRAKTRFDARSDCDQRRQGDAGHDKVARELGVDSVQRIAREMGGPFDARD
jgi:hypothetical protein